MGNSKISHNSNIALLAIEESSLIEGCTFIAYNMDCGISYFSLIPVRAEPAHPAELVNQLLFGELYIIQEKLDEWLRIKGANDQYEGFIHQSQHTSLDEKKYSELLNSDKSITTDLVHSIHNNDRKFPICLGSTLYNYDGVNTSMGGKKFIFSGKTISITNEIDQSEFVVKIAHKFLHAPYLWGGRSAFGIDCSGFVQVVFKVIGTQLPRDAWQQATEGKTMMFIHEARSGDVAFFENEEGKIIHTGIILEGQKIIHASGSVRIDTIDHYGIYNKELKKYSHKLRIIKRYL